MKGVLEEFVEIQSVPELPPELVNVDHIEAYYPGQKINFELDSDGAPQWLPQLVEAAKQYVQSPVVVDDFADDDHWTGRRPWRERLRQDNPEASEMIEGNRLRGNDSTSLFAYLELVSTTHPEKESGKIAGEIWKLYFEKYFKDHAWQTIDKKDKLRVVMEMGEYLIDLLNQIEIEYLSSDPDGRSVAG